MWESAAKQMSDDMEIQQNKRALQHIEPFNYFDWSKIDHALQNWLKFQLMYVIHGTKSLFMNS